MSKTKFHRLVDKVLAGKEACKALTISQPWAGFVATGWKVEEFRSWTTEYRGILAIHAAKNLNKGAMRAFKGVNGRLKGLHKSIRKQTGIETFNDVKALPRGVVVCFADLQDVKKVRGGYKWVFGQVVSVNPPQPATGRLGLWNLQDGMESC